MRLVFLTALLATASNAAVPPEAEARLGRVGELFQAGSYAAALDELKAVPALCNADALCLARTAAQSGSAHLMSGHYDLAASSFETSIAGFRNLGDTARLVDQLGNLGGLHYYRADYARAFATYRQAQAELRGHEKESWYPSAYQFTETNLATLYQRLGRDRQALEVYQRLGKSPHGLTPAEQAQMLANVAVLNRRLGDPWKTRDLLQRARALLKQDKNRNATIVALRNLGIVTALDFEDLSGAALLFEEALAESVASGNQREALQARLYLAETRFRQKDPARARVLWEQALDDARKLSAKEEEWRSLFGLARASQDAQESEAYLSAAAALIEQVRAGVGASSLKADFLADKTAVFEQLLRLQARRNDTNGAWRTMERSRAVILREEIGADSLPSLAELRNKLAPGDLLLEYHLGTQNTYLLWANKDAAGLNSVPLTEISVAPLIEAVLANFGAKGPQLAELSKALLPDVEGVRRVWIVPDGALAHLPFELLPTAGKTLLERAEVVYLPSGSLLHRKPPRQTGAGWPWQSQATAYGLPDSEKAGLLPGDESWAPLPATGREVDGIRRHLPAGVESFQGAGVEASGLLQAARKSSILHLATHGAGDLEDPDRSRLLIGKGYLFVSQLQPHTLDNLSLVVLSACQTERGSLRRGEGVQSLARAFLGAGAQTTVASLWKVDDAATTALMERFYRGLAQGMPVSSALRAAKLEFLRSGGPLAEPRYWAAFVTTGAADQAIPAFHSWSWVLAWSAAVLLVFAAGAWFSVRQPHA